MLGKGDTLAPLVERALQHIVVLGFGNLLKAAGVDRVATGLKRSENQRVLALVLEVEVLARVDKLGAGILLGQPVVGALVGGAAIPVAVLILDFELTLEGAGHLPSVVLILDEGDNLILFGLVPIVEVAQQVECLLGLGLLLPTGHGQITVLDGEGVVTGGVDDEVHTGLAQFNHVEVGLQLELLALALSVATQPGLAVHHLELGAGLEALLGHEGAVLLLNKGDTLAPLVERAFQHVAVTGLGNILKLAGNDQFAEVLGHGEGERARVLKVHIVRVLLGQGELVAELLLVDEELAVAGGSEPLLALVAVTGNHFELETVVNHLVGEHIAAGLAQTELEFFLVGPLRVIRADDIHTGQLGGGLLEELAVDDQLAQVLSDEEVEHAGGGEVEVGVLLGQGKFVAQLLLVDEELAIAGGAEPLLALVAVDSDHLKLKVSAKLLVGQLITLVGEFKIKFDLLGPVLGVRTDNLHTGQLGRLRLLAPAGHGQVTVLDGEGVVAGLVDDEVHSGITGGESRHVEVGLQLELRTLTLSVATIPNAVLVLHLEGSAGLESLLQLERAVIHLGERGLGLIAPLVERANQVVGLFGLTNDGDVEVATALSHIADGEQQFTGLRHRHVGGLAGGERVVAQGERRATVHAGVKVTPTEARVVLHACNLELGSGGINLERVGAIVVFGKDNRRRHVPSTNGIARRHKRQRVGVKRVRFHNRACHNAGLVCRVIVLECVGSGSGDLPRSTGLSVLPVAKGG